MLGAWEQHKNKLTERRRKLFQEIAAKRTDYIHLVIQDIHHPHNVSACLRSAEAFGIQNVHIVVENEKFKVSSVAKGAAKWLDIYKYSTVDHCIESLKKARLAIAAGYPPAQADHIIDEIPSKSPLALVYGNEHAGLNTKWRENLDIKFTIPMTGFVESLNISVAAAVSLYTIKNTLIKKMAPEDYYVSSQRQHELLNKWTSTHLNL